MLVCKQYTHGIELAYWAAARTIDQTDIGHLGIGSLGDATILHQENELFEFFDVIGERIVSDKKLVCDGLVVGGLYW